MEGFVPVVAVLVVVLLMGLRMSVLQNPNRDPQHDRLTQPERNLQSPPPCAEISARSPRQKNSSDERSQTDRRQDEAAVWMVGGGWETESGGDFDDISCLAGGEADEVLEDDDVLEACGAGREEELEFRCAVYGEDGGPVGAGEEG